MRQQDQDAARIQAYLNPIGQEAQLASKALARVPQPQINGALKTIAAALLEASDDLLKANEMDLAAAKKKDIPLPMLERLSLSHESIQQMAQAILDLTNLRSPVGDLLKGWTQPNGLEISQKRVPLGVVGMIYEARPNVTVDAACLCLKTQNAVILRGGSEAIQTNIALTQVIQDALASAQLPKNTVQLIDQTDRPVAEAFMQMTDYLDVLIPRGGAGLIRTVVEKSTVPVIETGVGNCHIFIDESADPKLAINILINAKTSRPAVCNAAESLLYHKDLPESFKMSLLEALLDHQVTLYGCEETQGLHPLVRPAEASHYAEEFLSMAISIKAVASIDEAIDHIQTYGTKHSEAIITTSHDNAEHFLNAIDAAAVYVNASTRFTDGGEFGFGAEIGISTQKLHARGPMGLEALTTTKYLIRGQGQVR